MSQFKKGDRVKPSALARTQFPRGAVGRARAMWGAGYWELANDPDWTQASEGPSGLIPDKALLENPDLVRGRSSEGER